ncbi:hypothetical protein CN378_05355 [Bacillus sp. AFS015802]|nr:hypothetical protein CN378_05355 [Bacillus sp. AFS015802]
MKRIRSLSDGKITLIFPSVIIRKSVIESRGKHLFFLQFLGFNDKILRQEGYLFGMGGSLWRQK